MWNWSQCVKQRVKGSVSTTLFTPSGPCLSLSLALSPRLWRSSLHGLHPILPPNPELCSLWESPALDSHSHLWASLSLTSTFQPSGETEGERHYHTPLGTTTAKHTHLFSYPVGHTQVAWPHLAAGLLILVSVYVLCQYKFTWCTGIFFLSSFF